MSNPTEMISLTQLDYLPYLDDNGHIPPKIQGKIGVYAIFDQDKVLQFVGYSRDLYLSLKQHLMRHPKNCYWLKIKTIERPSRAILEEIRQGWIQENGTMPPGNQEESQWIHPIDAKLTMTEADKREYENNDELGKIKFLKNLARKVEAQIQETLAERGVKMEIRFNPKLKEQGLLDLK